MNILSKLALILGSAATKSEMFTVDLNIDIKPRNSQMSTELIEAGVEGFED